MPKALRTLPLMLLVSLLPSAAYAYIGPGAGLGLIGTLLAVIGAALVALFGLLLFPIALIRKRRRNRAAQGGAPADKSKAGKN